MNKQEGIGTISMAIIFISFGLTSLLFSSFIVKKLGSKNSLFLGIMTCLPFIAYNFYPAWITMLPSAVLRGFGNSLLWASQCTYFNESAVLFCKVENVERKSDHKPIIDANNEKSDDDKGIVTFKTDGQTVDQISAVELLNRSRCNSFLNREVYLGDTSPVRFNAYRCEKEGTADSKVFSKGKNTDTGKGTQDGNLNILKDSEPSREQQNGSEEKKAEISAHADSKIIHDRQETANHQFCVDSTKAFFFGAHGLAYHSATIWSSLISYYVLSTGEKEGYNKTTNYSCGANFCSTNEKSSDSSIAEVPDNTRYLLIGVCIGCAIVAPLLVLLFLDRMAKRTKDVKPSWDHVFATIKYIKKKDQLLLIPFTIGASLCRGFYMAEFTKAYIACAWSISHIGLVTVIYGAISALTSIISGAMIKYFGRKSVMVPCHIITIANFAFLLFWMPDSLQPYLFYIQGGIFGVIAGIFNLQTKAFYGILFDGDEETAFSSCNLYTSIGWALPFVYGNFFCVSVKIYIVLAFSVAGFLGYLLAERSYSSRIQEADSTK